VKCPRCNRKLTADKGMEGRKGRCPCGHVAKVPGWLSRWNYRSEN
jgi:hypothetical protein